MIAFRWTGWTSATRTTVRWLRESRRWRTRRGCWWWTRRPRRTSSSASWWCAATCPACATSPPTQTLLLQQQTHRTRSLYSLNTLISFSWMLSFGARSYRGHKRQTQSPGARCYRARTLGKVFVECQWTARQIFFCGREANLVSRDFFNSYRCSIS